MAKQPKIEKVDGASKDVWAEHVEKLKQEFPEVVSEDQVDCEQLKRLVGEENVAQGERYSFTWASKSQAFGEIQSRTTKTLVPNREESVDFDDTENVFIEGENLEVLKILQKPYYGKVKMIYIDPPYNTGKDFIYKDNYRRSQKEEEEAAGNVDEEGNLKKGLVRNTKTGRYHSNWLNMMYPRLFLARNLLRDDGVIFVSIDDNEVHNLRMIMNEIFGEENFVAQVAWQNLDTIKNDAKYFSDNHEYVLVYAKNKEGLEILGVKKTEKQKSYYKNSDNDPRGPYLLTPLHAKSGTAEGVYEYIFSNDRKWIPPKGTYPRYSKETLRELEEENKIYFGKSGKGVPQKKTFLSEVSDRMKITTFWDYKFAGSTRQSNKELEELVGRGFFENPKPTSLLKILVEGFTQAQNDNVILDFFAGSGTTAHAVMAQNAEDGGNRKYIMVQLDEEVDEDSEAGKAGYENIAQIARERIRRAASAVAKAMEDKKENKDGASEGIDYGFKAFELSDSNFKPWRRESIESEKELQQKLEDAVVNLKGGAKQEPILFELMLKLGIPPTAEVQEKGGYYLVAGEHAICMEDEITEKLVEQVLAEKPHVFVCLDSAFAGNDELKTNTALQLKSKNIEFKVV